MTRHVLALTLGDPVGIGPEITAKTLVDQAGAGDHHGVAVGDPAALRRGAQAMGLDVEVRVVDHFDVEPAEGVIDCYDTGVLGDDVPEWGVVDKRAGLAAVKSIEVATQAAMDRKVAGIVTGPINKEAIWAAGSEHLGHTEMLGALTGVTKQDTMFVVRNDAAGGHHLRIFFTTRHVSLRQALDQITRESVGVDRQGPHRAEGLRCGGAPPGHRRDQPARRRERCLRRRGDRPPGAGRRGRQGQRHRGLRPCARRLGVPPGPRGQVRRRPLALPRPGPHPREDV
jgi:4-phospho-D-threonate 3-dehydrogenase / 4-phospho-D-erythronate 3-dehydrogenase